MGSLTHWRLSDEFVDRFPIYIETGYGDGNSLEYAVRHEFDQLYSVEIWAASAWRGMLRFSEEPNVKIIAKSSTSALPMLIEKHWSKGIFFFLDAHFPGADCDGQPYDAEPDMKIRLPLYREMAAIRKSRPNSNYCVLADDLQHYTAIDDHLDWFEPTHDIQRILDYGLICPRGAPCPEYVGERGT